MKLKEDHDKISILILIFFTAFLMTTNFVLSLIYKNFPVDTSNVVHVEKKLETDTSEETIYWASFYNYDLPGYENYGLSHTTAASRKYPKGTILAVTGVDSGKTVNVLVNDYGPELCSESNNYQGSGNHLTCVEREIDLSTFAYGQICNIPRGLCKVTIKEI